MMDEPLVIVFGDGDECVGMLIDFAKRHDHDGLLEDNCVNW